MIGKPYNTPCFCPQCSRLIECSSPVGHASGPEPGDLTVCLNCGMIFIFTDNLWLRRLTMEEVMAKAGDPQWLKLTAIQERIIRRGPLPPLLEA